MLQIAVFIWGIVILFKGKVSLSKKKIVKGTPARIIGLLFVSVLPTAVVIGFCIGLYFAMQGKQFDQQEFFIPGLLIELGLLATAVILAFVVASKYGKTEEQWLLAESGDAGEPQFGTPPGAEPVFDPQNPFSPPRG